jgi:hypothetical protein
MSSINSFCSDSPVSQRGRDLSASLEVFLKLVLGDESRIALPQVLLDGSMIMDVAIREVVAFPERTIWSSVR